LTGADDAVPVAGDADARAAGARIVGSSANASARARIDGTAACACAGAGARTGFDVGDRSDVGERGVRGTAPPLSVTGSLPAPALLTPGAAPALDPPRLESDPQCNNAPLVIASNSPIPVLEIRALNDGQIDISSADADVNEWLSNDKCEQDKVTTSGVCKTYTSCEAGTQVIDCRARGPHSFYYGDNPDNCLVPDNAWPFFKQFSLP
jgi:hypothetical protein